MKEFRLLFWTLRSLVVFSLMSPRPELILITHWCILEWGIHSSDLVVRLNDYVQTPWRRLEGPYCLHKVRVLHSSLKESHLTVKLSQLNKYFCSTCHAGWAKLHYRAGELWESTPNANSNEFFLKFEVLEMECPSRCKLNKGSNGGLDCSDLLNWENEVLFWVSELSSFVLEADYQWLHGLFWLNKCI